MFLMMIGLTTYFLLQRTFRQNTPEDAPRVEQKTTSEKILRTFETYTILVYDHSPFLRKVCATHLTQRQLHILNTPQISLRKGMRKIRLNGNAEPED